MSVKMICMMLSTQLSRSQHVIASNKYMFSHFQICHIKCALEVMLILLTKINLDVANLDLSWWWFPSTLRLPTQWIGSNECTPQRHPKQCIHFEFLLIMSLIEYYF
ncbi:hypothetical protein O6H91_18G005400 [Diphasiastrum complanatum]|uniref:Uncharacterized protein n=1 Tax=Diphasiastrum complanatum TaxID=34168 RepID=A0ACC2AXP8_DIPCM|nr:hypothetical protein O6H91_18G005400 [Diphasiastrum complanatum]